MQLGLRLHGGLRMQLGLWLHWGATAAPRAVVALGGPWLHLGPQPTQSGILDIVVRTAVGGGYSCTAIQTEFFEIVEDFILDI